MKKPNIQFIYPHPYPGGYSISFSKGKVEGNEGYAIYTYNSSEVEFEAYKFTESELCKYYDNLVVAVMRIIMFDDVKGGLWEQLADEILDDLAFYKPQEW